MNATQAIITLKNGARKYGMIISSIQSAQIQFVAGTEDALNPSHIEHIPMEMIVSIDTCLK